MLVDWVVIIVLVLGLGGSSSSLPSRLNTEADDVVDGLDSILACLELESTSSLLKIDGFGLTATCLDTGKLEKTMINLNVR